MRDTSNKLNTLMNLVEILCNHSPSFTSSNLPAKLPPDSHAYRLSTTDHYFSWTINYAECMVLLLSVCGLNL